jgi:hypothetical protein
VTEEQEDACMVQDELQQAEEVEMWPTHFDKQPSCIVGGLMRYLYSHLLLCFRYIQLYFLVLLVIISWKRSTG